MEYLKKDLLKVVVMATAVAVILACLAVWNAKTGALNALAGRLF